MGRMAIGPQTFLKVCEVGEKVMKCHWTARVELGVGLAIAVLGAFIILIASRQLRIGLTIGIIVNSILVILIPNVLIGVCKKTHMRCHALTLPALTVLGGVIYIKYLLQKERNGRL